MAAFAPRYDVIYLGGKLVVAFALAHPAAWFCCQHQPAKTSPSWGVKNVRLAVAIALPCLSGVVGWTPASALYEEWTA